MMEPVMATGVGVRSLPAFGGPVKTLALHESSRELHLSSRTLQLAPPVGGAVFQHWSTWDQQFLEA